MTIAKPLTVRAAGQPAAEAGDCFAASVSDPATHASVDPADGSFTTAFNLRADAIELRGLVVQGASVGIDASDAFSGYQIRKNLIEHNTLFGADFGSSGKLRARAMRRADGGAGRRSGGPAECCQASLGIRQAPPNPSREDFRYVSRLSGKCRVYGGGGRCEAARRAP